MSYCTNCGAQYDEPASICAECQLDPRLPEAIIDANIARRNWRRDDPSFGYPGEAGALGLSGAVAIGLAIVLGVVSLGLFLVLVVLALIQLRLALVAYRRNAISVGPRSFPTVHRLAKVAAYRLKLRCPEVYVRQHHEYNAQTRGFARHGFIVVNSALVQDFKPAELLFVIGHEMGHIKRFHTTWLTLLHPASVGGARFLLGPAMQLIFNVWSVKAEYTADQAGLIACGDVKPACSTLLKLAGGIVVEREVDLRGIHASRQEEVGLGGLLEYLSDHPFIQNRVRHLASYAESRSYAAARWW
jgi:Zn-dependent protease with chaperone function